jgi:hypothetical protein
MTIQEKLQLQHGTNWLCDDKGAAMKYNTMKTRCCCNTQRCYCNNAPVLGDAPEPAAVANGPPPRPRHLLQTHNIETAASRQWSTALASIAIDDLVI